MPAFVEMHPRVPMRRGVTAADVPASQAQTQVHPPRADSQAILAAFGARRYFANHFQMRVSHVVSFSSGRRSMVEPAFRLSPFSGSEVRSCRARARQRGVRVPSRRRRVRTPRSLELRRLDGLSSGSLEQRPIGGHRSIFDRRREVRYADLFLREFWIIAGVGVGEPVFPGLCLVRPFLHLDTPVGQPRG
jgi:hypothetical protein